MDNVIYKKCITCCDDKVLCADNFHFRKPEGKWKNECRECGKKRSRKRYTNRTEEQIEIDSKRYLKTPIQMRLWKLAKARAKKKGLDFDILPEDIVVPTHCPVFPEVKLDQSRLTTCATLDRFDNSKGYIRDNIRVISHLANSIKGFASADQLYRVADYASGKLLRNDD